MLHVVLSSVMTSHVVLSCPTLAVGGGVANPPFVQRLLAVHAPLPLQEPLSSHLGYQIKSRCHRACVPVMPFYLITAPTCKSGDASDPNVPKRS